MRIKSRNFVCYSFILFLIISGIGFSVMKTDSLSKDIRKNASNLHFFGFLCVSADDISPYTQLHIRFFYGKWSPHDFCTTEMLGIQDSFRMAKSMEYSDSTVKTPGFHFWCEESRYGLFWRICERMGETAFPGFYRSAVLLKYIQNQDGKK